MTTAKIFTMAAVWAALTATAAATPASAGTVDLGNTADVDIVDIENGADVEVEQHWTISNLKPSTDAISYSPAGTLWEATAAVLLDHGGIPVISGFFARSGTDSYPVLWTVAAPAAVAPGALPPGGSATGKMYFDVTGAPPDSVAFRDADDLVVWQNPTS